MANLLFVFVLLMASTILPNGVASPTPSDESNILIGRAPRDDFLTAHNTFRAKHGASALVWDSSLASTADKWAANCKFEHSQSSYGENLAAGTGSDYDIASAVKSWTDEASSYDPDDPSQSYHFTQVVWKSTKKLGCAVHVCDGIFDDPAKFVVCEYDPPGNIDGEYKDNVQA